MTYRFADNSPFPLDSDFLGTLARMTRACVRALAFEDELIRAEEQARAVRDDAERAAAILDAVAGRVVGAIAGAEEAEEPGVAGLVRRVMEETSRTVGTYRRRVSLRRDARMATLAEEESRRVQAFLGAIAEDLSLSDLPGVRQHVMWEAEAATPTGRGARLAVTDLLEEGLEASWQIAIPAGHRFTGPVRIGDLRRGVGIPLPVERGWIRRRTDVALIDLDEARLVSAARMPEGVSLIVAPRPSGALVSLWIDVTGEVTLRGGGADMGVLDEGQAQNVLALAGEVMRALGSLRSGAAQTLESASVDGYPIEQRPAAFAERAIEIMAPVVHELRRRHEGSAGELILKRDLGGNRREEIFLSVHDLLQPVRTLDLARQSAFAPLGYEVGGMQARPITVTPSPEITEVAREFVVAPRRVPLLRADDSVILRKAG